MAEDGHRLAPGVRVAESRELQYPLGRIDAHAASFDILSLRRILKLYKPISPMPHSTDNRTQDFSDEDLRRIITKQLPAWKRACAASNADAIVLHESAFGRSHSEFLLLACAIKYAALSNKRIHIVCGKTNRPSGSGATHKVISVQTFRERGRDATAPKSQQNKTHAR